jgi:hypothetical protein
MWASRGFSEVDKQVCHDLAKVLNAKSPAPTTCLIKFPEQSSFQNLVWSELDAKEALELERIRLGRSGGSSCKAASPHAKVDKKTMDMIISRQIVYRSAVVDIDNNGEKDLLFQKVWKERLCDDSKEYVTPLGSQLMYACKGKQGLPIDMLPIASLDAFKYKNKHYLFSWHGIPPSKGYINVNEYVSTPVGAEILLGVRQVCRINYHRGTKE